MVVNACWLRYAASNLAENFTQPVDYFDFGSEVKKMTFSAAARADWRSTSLLILGGGGIFSEGSRSLWPYLEQIVNVVPSAIPIVIWGMGINDHGRREIAYDPTLSRLERRPNVLIGLRDTAYHNWVPCVSCMRPEFDCGYTTKHEVVFYGHYSFEATLPYPTMWNAVRGNPVDDFARVVAFLASSEVVVTNTYHGAYWALLLERRVVIYAPFSNKFFALNPNLPIASDDAELKSALPRAFSRPGLLKDSRAATRAFYRRVISFRPTLVPIVGRQVEA